MVSLRKSVSSHPTTGACRDLPGLTSEADTAHGCPVMPLTPPGWTGSGAGSRWLLRGAAGEELVVAAAGEVPLDPGAVGVVEDVAGEAAGVHGGVVPLAE